MKVWKKVLLSLIAFIVVVATSASAFHMGGDQCEYGCLACVYVLGLGQVCGLAEDAGGCECYEDVTCHIGGAGCMVVWVSP